MTLTDAELTYAVGVALNAAHAAAVPLASALRKHRAGALTTDTTTWQHTGEHATPPPPQQPLLASLTTRTTPTTTTTTSTSTVTTCAVAAAAATQLARVCAEEAMGVLRGSTPHYAIETLHLSAAVNVVCASKTTTTPTTTRTTAAAVSSVRARDASAADTHASTTTTVSKDDVAVTAAEAAAAAATTAAHSHNDESKDNAAHDEATSSDSAAVAAVRTPVWLLGVAAEEAINVMHGVPECCVSLALRACDGEVVLGVVCVPCLNEVYCAAKGRGAFCNGERLHVSPTCALSQSVVYVPQRPALLPYDGSDGDGRHGCACRCHGGDGSEDGCRCCDSLLSLQALLVRVPVHAIRASGALAIEMCLVAAGRAEVCVRAGAPLCAYAAAAVVVREAGGVLYGIGDVLRFDETQQHLLCCASNAALMSDVVQMARESKFAQIDIS